MAPEDTITEVTRRAIIDYLSVGRHWSGAVAEDEFLGRLYDLNRMPSTDSRWQYDTAAKDIRQHRVNNVDWSDDWVFTDGRFNLLHGGRTIPEVPGRDGSSTRPAGFIRGEGDGS